MKELLVEESNYDKDNPKYLILPDIILGGTEEPIKITKTAQEVCIVLFYLGTDIDFNKINAADNPAYQKVDGDGAVYANITYGINEKRLIN